MKRLFIAVALALLALVAAPLATYADHDGYLYPAAAWDVREIGADLVWHPASESAIVDETTLSLVKPVGDVGTSAETTDLSIEGDEVTVDVILGPGADAAAGAIRLFAYDHPDGNTLTEAPQQVAVAVGAGQLTLDVSGFAGPIGTLGMTYDGSNASDGEVIFKNLQVDGETVAFTAHVEPEPDPDPTTEPEPKLATSDKTCSDFDSRTALNRHLATFPGDTDRLDGNDDGVPCNELDDAESPVTVPTSVPAGLSGMPERGDPIWPWLVGIGVILAVAVALVFNRVTSEK